MYDILLCFARNFNLFNMDCHCCRTASVFTSYLFSQLQALLIWTLKGQKKKKKKSCSLAVQYITRPDTSSIASGIHFGRVFSVGTAFINNLFCHITAMGLNNVTECALE